MAAWWPADVRTAKHAPELVGEAAFPSPHVRSHEDSWPLTPPPLPQAAEKMRTPHPSDNNAWFKY